VVVGDDAGRARIGEMPADRRTDRAGAARDHGDLVFQAGGTHVAVLNHRTTGIPPRVSGRAAEAISLLRPFSPSMRRVSHRPSRGALQLQTGVAAYPEKVVA